MKKTLAAVAVLGAFAGSALAADVTLYGRVDTGFQYNNVNSDINKSVDKTVKSNKFSMESGQSSGSRWGLKGVEDLGAFKVGFILEDGFSGDTGADTTPMFNRESSLFIEGDFGKLAVGRIGSINQGTSSWGQFTGMTSGFGTSYKNAAVSNIILADAVRENMIAYQTPTFAGVTGFVQYGMGANDNENESSTDRYYAVGAKYVNGPLGAFVSVDSINYKTYTGTNGGNSKYIDDSLKVTAAVNYNFDVAKVYVTAQYFDEVANPMNANMTKKGLMATGYGVSLGVDAPIAGGTLMTAIGYLDAEAADTVTDKGGKAADYDLTRYQLAVGYKYNLSKRTSVYGAAALLKDKCEFGKVEEKVTATQAMFGLLHTF